MYGLWVVALLKGAFYFDDVGWSNVGVVGGLVWYDMVTQGVVFWSLRGMKQCLISPDNDSYWWVGTIWPL